MLHVCSRVRSSAIAAVNASRVSEPVRACSDRIAPPGGLFCTPQRAAASSSRSDPSGTASPCPASLNPTSWLVDARARMRPA
ncbi:hypothetical protein ACIFOC_00062 [Leucobacter aridicollis]